MQLIHVGNAITEVDEPLRTRSKRPLAYSLIGGVVSIPALLCTLFISGTAAMLAVMLLMCAVIGLVIYANASGAFLPESARRFLSETRAEYRRLDREARALNGAWCLAERHRRLLPSGDGADAPWQARHDALQAELDTYLACYRSAIAADLAEAAARPVDEKAAARYRIASQAQQIDWLDRDIARLGDGASEAMRAQAQEMRRSLLDECDKHGLPRRLAGKGASAAYALPAARVIRPT